MKQSASHVALGAVAALCASGIAFPAVAAWEPVRPVEFIVPAGTGGGADQMARTIQGIVTKHNLMKQPMVVINKSGGAGGEGFLDLKTSAGNPHKIVITLSNLFTTPLATGVRSFQLKGIPVASGVVNRFESVMTILCGLPADVLRSRKPSPPAPPDLLITTIGCFIRLCLVTMPWMVRAI